MHKTPFQLAGCGSDISLPAPAQRPSRPPRPPRPPPPPPPPPRETNLLGLGEASPPAPRAEPNLLGSPPISRSEPNLLGLDAPAADSLNMFAGLDATAPAPAPAPMQSNNAPDPFAAAPPPRRSSAPPPKGTFDAFSDFKL